MALLIIHTGIFRISADYTLFTDICQACCKEHQNPDQTNDENQPIIPALLIRKRKRVFISQSTLVISSLSNIVTNNAIQLSENEIRRLQTDFENSRHLLN